MMWFGRSPDVDDPDIRDLRSDPGFAPGWSPARIGLIVLFGGVILTAWLIMPLGSWFSKIWGGFGLTREPPAKVAGPPMDDRDLKGLQSQHIPTRPEHAFPWEGGAPAAPAPHLSMYDELKLKYDWLAQQYESLKAQLQSQKTIEPPKTPVQSPAPTQETEAQKRRRAEAKQREEEAKKKRANFFKSDVVFLTRKKEDKAGQLHALKSPYSLAPSETIPCETTMEISSDTPGAFVAIVRQDVPDTATRQYKVLPKGSKFVMKPRGKAIFGDSRMEIQTHTLTFPGGSWLKMPAHTVTDRAGTAGFTGEIDRHYVRIFGSIIITGVLRGGTTIVGGYGGGVGERIGGAIVQEGSAEGQRQTRQFMRTDPTITVDNHYECQLLLEDELVLTRSFGRMP